MAFKDFLRPLRDLIKIKSQTPEPGEELEASCADSSAARLEELAYKSRELAFLVAQNPHAPSALLEKLATPGGWFQTNPPGRAPSPWTNPDRFDWEVDSDILREIAKNPNTPPKMLLSLASRFPKEAVQNPALSLVLLEDPQLLYRLDAGALVGLVDSEEFAHLMERVVAHPNVQVRVSMAEDSDASTELLTRLAQDPAEEVRKTALQHRNLVSV